MGKVTILGQHIRLIRPERINMPVVTKRDLPKGRYCKRPKTIKEHCGKVVAILIKLKSGGIRSVRTGTGLSGIHPRVLEVFDIDPKDVVASGWELENGNYIWK